MVLPPLARGPQPHVLPVRVREQEQLQPSDKPRQLREPRPPALLQVHREVHSDGALPRAVHILGLHDALLQANVEQEADHERHRLESV